MDDKQQSIKVSSQDIEIITRSFKENEPLLKSVRALFLGLGVSEEEKGVIKDTFANPEVRALMWKRFCPELTKDSPIGQVQDVWLGVEQMVFSQSRDTIEQAIKYKELAIDMTRQALSLLDNPDAQAPDLQITSGSLILDPLGVALLARNQFIRHVESQLLFLWLIANQKQAAQTNPQDSSK